MSTEEIFRFGGDDVGLSFDQYSLIMVRKDVVSRLLRDFLKTMGNGGIALIYRAGHALGAISYDSTITSLKTSDRGIVLRALDQYLRGTGILSLIELRIDLERMTLNAEFRDCFETKAYGRDSSKPVCHLARGVLSGVAERVLGVDNLAGDEQECEGAGAKICRVRVHPLLGGHGRHIAEAL